MAALLMILALIAFALIANRFGADSRDFGADWALPGQHPVARR
jgi:hypothetical protein